MPERFGYRSALYLSAIIVLVNCCWFIHAKFFLLRPSDGAAIHVVGSTLVLVGLWLQSRMARYVGAVYFLFTAGAAVYGLTSLKHASLSELMANISIVCIVVAAVLGLMAASILVISRPFAREFAAERERRPAYKKLVLNVYTVLIALAAAAATLVDIVHIFSI